MYGNSVTSKDNYDITECFDILVFDITMKTDAIKVIRLTDLTFLSELLMLKLHVFLFVY